MSHDHISAIEGANPASAARPKRATPRKDDKGGGNGCNDYCVYDRHDTLFRDGSNSMKMTGLWIR